MCPCARAGPASALPAFHSSQFRSFVNLHNTVDLSIGVYMVLPSIFFFTIHVDSGDTKIARLWLREANSGSSVFFAVDLDCCTPAFVLVDSLANILDKIIVIFVSWPVVGVEVLLKVLTGSPETVRKTRQSQPLGNQNVQILHFGEEFSASFNQSFCGGKCLEIDFFFCIPKSSRQCIGYGHID